MSRPSTLLPVLLFALAAAPACTTYSSWSYVGDASYRLGTFQKDGRDAVVDLEVTSGSGDAWLRVRAEGEAEEPSLGVRYREVGKARAAELGVRPYAGVEIVEVLDGSPAASAGIVAGDLITEIDGRPVVDAADYEAILETAAGRGAAIPVSVSRGEGFATAAAFDVAPTTRTVPVREDSRVQLLAGRATDRPLLGTTLRSIHPEWEDIVFPGEDPVVVTGVASGSPAYLAGLRAGDIVRTVGGDPVGGVEGFQAQIQRAHETGGSLAMEVTRADEAGYAATARPDDYSGDTSFYFPLVMDVDASARRTEWSFGPWGLIAGYRGEYQPSPDRRPRHDSAFSAILGLFKVSENEHRTSVRLLWFIHFDT